MALGVSINGSTFMPVGHGDAVSLGGGGGAGMFGEELGGQATLAWNSDISPQWRYTLRKGLFMAKLTERRRIPWKSLAVSAA